MLIFEGLWHILISALMFVLSMWFFVNYKRTKLRSSANLSIFFGLFFGYSFSIGMSALLFRDTPEVIAWAFFFAVCFLYAVKVQGIRLLVFPANSVIYNRGHLVLYGVVAWAGIIITALFFFPAMPTFTEGGYIFWNLSPILGWGIGISSFITAFIWSYSNYVIQSQIEDEFSQQKRKIRMFIITGIFWMIAGTIYFPSHNEIQTKIAFYSLTSSALFPVLLYIFLQIRSRKNKVG